MRAFIVVFGVVFAAAPALAQTAVQPIGPAEASAHIGQSVTVEGAANNVVTVRSGVTLIDIGGRYPDNPFTAVILAADANKFPDIRALNGKTVDVSGPVKLYRGKPEIVLSEAAQIRAK